MGTSSNLVWARGQGLRNTGGGDTVETEESVEQDRDETVGYNSFPNTKLIFETCLYRIRSRIEVDFPSCGSGRVHHVTEDAGVGAGARVG